MNKISLILAFSCLTLCLNGQDNFLIKGNSLLKKGDFEQAQRIFKEAITANPESNIYRVQLGLSLLKQEKYKEAEVIFSEVLELDSKNVLACWYSGICNYQLENNRISIKRFEYVLALKGLNKKPQSRSKVESFENDLAVFSVDSNHYHLAMNVIARCYARLLKTEGLTYSEADRMFTCFDEYLRLQPHADDVPYIKNYISYQRNRRPSEKGELWIDP